MDWMIPVPFYSVNEDGLICFDSAEDEMKSFVFVKSLNKFYNPLTGSFMGITAFDLEFAGCVPRKAGRPSVYAKADLCIESVEDVIYYPRVDPGAVFTLDGMKYVNAVVPLSVPGVPDKWEEDGAWSDCLVHLGKIFEMDDANVIMKWMAHNVQFPGKKILWAPIIVGTQGDGKTTIVKMMSAAMGRRNVKHVSPEALDSAFNGYASGAAVVALEEVRVIGKSRHPIMEKLKPLLTNDVIEVVSKGQDGKQVPNTTNYIALTNHEDALVLDENDRRWGVFRTKFKNRSELIEAIDEDYWNNLHKAIEESPGSIRGWLKSVDLTDFNPYSAPALTEAKKKMIKASRSGAAEEIEAVLGTHRGVTEEAVLSPALADAMKKVGGYMPRGRGLKKAMEELGFKSFRNAVRFDEYNGRAFYRGTEEPSLTQLKAMLEKINSEWLEDSQDDNPFA